MEDKVKALVRPFVIMWGFIIWGVLLWIGKDVPVILQGLISAVIVEYSGERAVKRLRGK